MRDGSHEIREPTIDFFWLCTAWAGVALLAWIYSLTNTVTGALSTSTITLLALVFAAVGYWLRRKAIIQHTVAPSLVNTNDPATSSELDDNSAVQGSRQHLIGIAMMLGLAASVNWFGCLVLQSSTLLEMIPALVIFTVSELALDLDQHLRLPSLLNPNSTSQQVSEHDGTLAAEAETIESETKLADITLAEEPAQTEDLECESLANTEGAVRNTIEQFDLSGKRSLSGFICTNFASDQKKQELVVAFCPPFNNQPEVEFEPDDERVEAKLVNCTPIGARFLLRKTEADESFSCRLEWYATSADDDSENSLITSRILP